VARLRLATATPRSWVDEVAASPLELLSDHAHCELKAAASAQSLIARHPRERALVVELASIAAEEIAHFSATVALLHARGGELDRLARNAYAEALLARAGGADALLDRLLVSALIEARSLERFLLLAEHLADLELAAFYRSLVASEASHQAAFLRLAREHAGEDAVRARLAVLVEAEARALAAAPRGPRMHSGVTDTG